MSVKKSDYLHNNPVTGVHMFQYRVENFFSQYLLSSANPLGEITDHVIKIEFQMRGTPHAHCLLWVEDAPKISRDPNNVVCAFIDKYISATTPPTTHESSHDNAIVTRLQKHSHSDYCCTGIKNVDLASQKLHHCTQSFHNLWKVIVVITIYMMLSKSLKQCK